MHTSLILACILGAEPEKPVEFAAADIALLFSEKPADREATWKKFDGKLVKLTGIVVQSNSVMYSRPVFTFPKKPKDAKIEVEFPLAWADTPLSQENAAIIGRNVEKGAATHVTLWGRCKFSVRFEQPTDSYKVPAGLLPPKRPAPSTTGLAEMSEQIQRQIIEEEERRTKIMEDARKKGQTEFVVRYGANPTITDVVWTLKDFPKKK